MSEQTLGQGEIVTIQFDRPSALLGLEMAQDSGFHNDIPGLALLASRKDLDDDFSASALVIDFLVSTASSVTAAAVTAKVSKVLSERGKKKGITIVVTLLPRSPEDRSLRLGVTSKDQPADQS